MHYSNQNKIYKSLDLTLAPEMIRKQFQTLIGPAKRGEKTRIFEKNWSLKSFKYFNFYYIVQFNPSLHNGLWSTFAILLYHFDIY